MASMDFACVFIRATGDRLVGVEQLVLAFPHLFGAALAELDVAYRVSSRLLVVVLRFAPGADAAVVRARLQFWVARAGGRASALGRAQARDVRGFRANFDACELKEKGMSPATLFDASGPLFTAAGAPRGRRRSLARRLTLVLDVAGPGWKGVRYHPDDHALFVPAPIAPPLADELAVAFRVPGVERPFETKAVVAQVRTVEDAGPGEPAGYTVVVEAPPPELHDALVRHASWDDGARFRVAPRYAVKAPVKVTVPPESAAPVGAGPRAFIEYATDQELAADYVENLSQGGAFVRTPHPAAVGTTVALELRLPNGAELRTAAVVAFADASGMGVRFELDAEMGEVLASAIAHLSARPRRALIVDDDALVRRMLADALQLRGFEVLAATDGITGLQTLSEEVLALDLLITDLRMPGMDGEAFVRTIRNAGGEADLAIVAVTGRMEAGLESRLEQAGADAVLEKALGPELIAQAADAVLERKRLLQAGREI
jgi:CheY-like chemotaxis protein